MFIRLKDRMITIGRGVDLFFPTHLEMATGLGLVHGEARSPKLLLALPYGEAEAHVLGSSSAAFPGA